MSSPASPKSTSQSSSVCDMNSTKLEVFDEILEPGVVSPGGGVLGRDIDLSRVCQEPAAGIEGEDLLHRPKLEHVRV